MKRFSIIQLVTLIFSAGIFLPDLVSGQSTNDYDVCQGATEIYWIQSPGVGSTFVWNITPGTSGIEWIITENSNDTIQVQWNVVGTYIVQVVETSIDGCEGDPVMLTVTVSELPTVADAGPDQNICGSLDATMGGNTAIVGTGTWSQFSGPGTISFTNINDPVSSVTTSDYGEYILRWTITNGICPASIDDVALKFSPKPVTNGIWHN